MKNINLNKLNRILQQGQIDFLGPLEEVAYKAIVEKLVNKERVTLVNIICPGYQRRREGGVEDFDFPRLSSDITNCPNVVLMITKMCQFLALLRKFGLIEYINPVMILADVAILNFEHLSEIQDVKQVLDDFYLNISQSDLFDVNEINFLKMSQLPSYFRKIPIGGINVPEPQFKRLAKEKDIEKISEEYIGTLMFGRINTLMSENNYVVESYQSILKQSSKEVRRFMMEYGLAGRAIRKTYINPLVLFTEPSGYLRGYFYNTFLPKKERLPVIYLR